MATSWTIGSASDCDLVVELPTVSGHHCRLIHDDTGYVLEDLGSTNGTYVNGTRVVASASVKPSDTVTLGLAIPMPWPSEPAPIASRVVRIGRESDNDVVVDLPTVSGHHARVVWEGKPGEAVIEDLGSSNGTAVGSPDRKVTRSAFSLGDTIYLGSHPVPAALLLVRFDPSIVPSLPFRGDELVIGRDPGCGWVIDLPMVSSRHARLRRSGDRVSIEDLTSSNGTFVNGLRIEGASAINDGDLIGLGSYPLLLAVEPGTAVERKVVPLGESGPDRQVTSAPDGQPGPRSAAPRGRVAEILVQPTRVLLLLLQAVVVGMGVVIASGMDPRAATAPVLFWLGLAAVWFGLSDAVLGNLIDSTRLRGGLTRASAGPLLHRFAVLAILCLCQCAISWGIVANASGLRGPGFSSVAVLMLASLVGLAAGLLLVVLSPRPSVAWASLGPIMLVLWLFGGERESLPRMAPWARAVANALPSRWAFEGLLLLEADARTGRDPAADPSPTDGPDLAEDYFPAETVRTGPRGAAMALGFLLVGLSASAAFTARASRPAS